MFTLTAVARSFVLVLALIITTSSPTLADVITVTYSGLAFGNVAQIPIFSSFSGTLTYHNPEQLQEPDSWFTQPGDGFTFNVDGFNFSYATTSSVPGQVGAFINLNLNTPADLDELGVHTLHPETTGAKFETNFPFATVTGMDLQFEWPAGTLLPGFLPDPFNTNQLDYFASSAIAVDIGLSNGDILFGRIFSAEATVVPEPDSWVLVASLLVLVAVSHSVRTLCFRPQR